MKKRLILPLMSMLLILSTTALFADFQAIIRKAEELNQLERHKEVKEFLLEQLKTVSDRREKAELYWRIARATLNLGDEAEDNGASKDTLLKIFEEGESYATEAIKADPENYNGYYWKSANIGRWGQTKGILNSLFKAGPMRDLLVKAISLKPDFPDAYYVLGQLYEQVPGFPVSFGNADYAVSLGRLSVDLYREWYDKGLKKEIDYDYYTELAKHLYKRNWDSRKRKSSQAKKKRKYQSTRDVFEKGANYEGVITLKSISDREEAREMIKWVIDKLSSIGNRKRSQNDDLKEAKETLASWK